ncbi:hypothetical protein [Haloferax sulfurifontis]|uniref:Uncharacterized protein n=1 Tax=Haloferax sulfurifontis TaxID=255616 RepID=A0A830DTZ6_9EURY|nr:hypothetical protein [Haloferax sulfurifontis]GGC49885.1 hypothetical protein GCM10007209_09430 [Haloferax sulfurifontis]
MKHAFYIVVESVRMVLVTITLAIVILLHILDIGDEVEPTWEPTPPKHAFVGPTWTDADGFTYYFISEPVEGSWSGRPRVVVRPCG